MKKTYISPATLTVQLSTCHMMADSLYINTTYNTEDTNTYISNSDQILTKENKDIDLWDNEW